MALSVLLVVLVGAATVGGQRDGGPAGLGGAGDVARDDDAVVPFSWVATVAAGNPAVTVFDAPDAASGQRAFPSPTVTGDPLVFLVDGNDVDQDWLPVFLPVGPSGSRGWVRTADVALDPNVYRVEVALGARTLKVRRGDEVVIDTPIGVGAGATPTPGGTYFLAELIRQPPGDGDGAGGGTYGYELSGGAEDASTPARADVHGDDGTLGIDGPGDQGGIRVPDDVITEMVDILPLGTPVDVRA
ncbi:MAG TPA: L,D-transpeptidase [Acidimicrobiales bacterium]|nr:L,D-transpeptidase [Acidimicrobiales bacterium]